MEEIVNKNKHFSSNISDILSILLFRGRKIVEICEKIEEFVENFCAKEIIAKKYVLKLLILLHLQ